MKTASALLGLALLAVPASAHLKMPKDPPSPLAKRAVGSPAGVLYYWGYSHVDFNWLWDWNDTTHTWDSTAESTLNLMYRFPDFHFGETQAAAYLAIERIRPDVFANIKTRVADGHWGILGGMWDESDENLPSGEGLARSFLYGQNYFQEKFGKQAKTGFLPDTFGHTRQMPQILKQAEINNFYFQRCAVPNLHLFNWQAPDGSKVLAYSSPGWYNDHVDQTAQTNFPATVKAESGVNIAGVCYGVGDHGGGPTITDLTTLDMLKTDPNYPEVRMAMPDDFFDAVRADANYSKVPTVNRDLQYTFEGCYTTHDDMKHIVRDAENELYVAESLASLSSMYGGDYPADDLRYGWRHEAFNHFHDIAPGTAIHGTYVEAGNKQKLLKQILEKVERNAWNTIEPHVDTTGAGTPVAVYNPLAWTRTDAVETTVAFPSDTPYVTVTDATGAAVPAQITGKETRDGQVFVTFLFVAQNMPSMGYRVYHVAPAATDNSPADRLTVANNVVTTPQLVVTLDGTTGQVSQIHDVTANRDAIPAGQRAMRLVALPEATDNSAWTISLAKDTGGNVLPPTYMDTPVAGSVKMLETGPVRAHFQAQYKNGASTYTQDIFVYRGLPRVDSRLTVDFQDYNVLVKTIIPTPLTNPSAYFDVPFYAINRATDGHLDVPLQKWMDESDSSNYGISVLNDCKYGADVNGATMRLSLLRGTQTPDNVGDKGMHTIGYSIYPHAGDWKAADTMRRGYQFNVPLRVMPVTPGHTGDMTAEHAFLSANLGNIVITALKKAEDGDGYIVRWYDTKGQTLSGAVTLPLTPTSAKPVNILEHALGGSNTITGNAAFISTKPYAIQSMRVKF